MKEKRKYLLLLLVLLPSIVLASGGETGFPLGMAFFMEAFITIHMTVFVILPLSKIINPTDSKKTFWTLFIGRIVILLLADILISPSICMADFFLLFIGAFIVNPVAESIARKKNNNVLNAVVNTNVVANTANNNTSLVIKCTKCGNQLSVNDKFCTKCGTPFEGNNVQVSSVPKVIVKAKDFDPIFSNSEEVLLEHFIKKELVNAGVTNNKLLIPENALKKKKILSIIFSVLIFVYVSMIFFHFPLLTYILGIIILIIFYIVSNRYDFIDYLKKEIKSRPSEKISNIVMNTKNSLVNDSSKGLQVLTAIGAIVIALVLFINPRIMYEKVDGGYAVRFYTFGLTNYKTATIPDTYKGEKIVSLRGNTFSNMPFLTKVTLSDNITEIRGQAFKNDRSLVSVNIPKNLEYLGGGAFYNCTSITEISLPDTLTQLGGESFYGASSLRSVKLSDNLTEIRGDTFEECTSLTSITIPDKVTRIGGHAFYGDISLSEVNISQNSALTEIGSSAFRRCDSLYEITIPASTYVNERAFKESPTSVHRYGSLDNDYNNGDYYE